MPWRRKKTEGELLMSTGAISEIFGVPQHTVRYWCTSAKISCWVTKGGHYRLRYSDVARFLDQFYEYFENE